MTRTDSDVNMTSSTGQVANNNPATSSSQIVVKKAPSQNVAGSAQESSYASASGRGKGKGMSDSEDDTLIKRSRDNTHHSAAAVKPDVEMKSSEVPMNTTITTSQEPITTAA